MVSSRPAQDQLLGWMESLSNWGRWGDDDELGTLNFITAEKTAAATKLVEEGVTVTCSRPIDYAAGEHSPRPPQHFMVRSGDRFRPGDGIDRQVAMDYFGLIFHGHSVTHIDSLSHFFWDGRMYNGRPSSLVTTEEGATKEAIDIAHRGIVSRGVLVDVPMLRGVDWIEPGDGVGIADIEAAEEQCGFKIEPGDVLLMRTGQYKRIVEQGPLPPTSSSGPLPEILPLVHERGVAVSGSDTGNDVQPSGYERFSNPYHQIGIVALGIWILDNANLEDLSAACQERNRWEFLLNILPLRIPNGTGSPCNPVALF